MIDEQGGLFRWEVARDSSSETKLIHSDFEKNNSKVAALAYMSHSSLLFSASKKRLISTDVNNLRVSEVNLVTPVWDMLIKAL
jgi:hypothetical protein